MDTKQDSAQSFHGGAVPTLRSGTGKLLQAFALASITGLMVQHCGHSLPVTTAPTPAMPTGISLSPADPANCPFGGTVISSFADANGDGLLEDGEAVLARSVLCNGAPGAQGAQGAPGTQGQGAGIEVLPATSVSCPFGGLTVTTYVDADNNGLRDAKEKITSKSTLCNGAPGSDGRDGFDGRDGASARITVTTATSAQCPAGGAVYTTVSPGEAPRQTVICDGVAGADGRDGQNGRDASWLSGPVGPSVAGKAYSACHHDYLYIPGSAGARGWLTFRHQGNGLYDQGIGNTGFQIWNVDIADFLLIAEQGSVTYCSLHWDALALTLAYHVVDATDGLNGLIGSLKL